METITVQEQWDNSLDIEGQIESKYPESIAIHNPILKKIDITTKSKNIKLYAEITTLSFLDQFQKWVLDSMISDHAITLTYSLKE